MIRFLGTLILFIRVFLAVGQESGGENIAKRLKEIKQFPVQYPREKVYLHFDNTSYFVGDTLWFSAYLVNSLGHTGSDWSRTLYVELLTPEGEVIETRRYKTTRGRCHGEIALRDSLQGGFYEVRAYTRWMMNFGDRDIFSRIFAVFDKPQRPGEYSWKLEPRGHKVDYRVDDFVNQKDKKKGLDLCFYPEGGNLVKGQRSKVAFKAIAPDGSNAELTGIVRDAAGKDITFFSTFHDGMGIFELCPENLSYGAEVEYEGKKYHFDLPAVLPEGVTLRVRQDNPSGLQVIVSRNGTVAGDSLGLSLCCRGRLLSAVVLPPASAGNQVLDFITEDYPSGVVQVTLFDAAGMVLAERLVFINHHDVLSVGCEGKKEYYSPFAPVDLNFTVKDHTGQGVAAAFSLAVRDAENCTEGKNQDNILTYLLLSSELKGYVHDPGYYFLSDDRVHRSALDMLLLVQGWSRYVWRQMAGVDTLVVNYPAEECISIDGKVLQYGIRSKPRAHAEVLAWMYSGGESYKGKTRTDSLGRFVFARDLWGDWNLSLQVTEEGKRKNSDIRLNRFFAPKARKLSWYEKQIPRLTELPEKSGADGGRDSLPLVSSQQEKPVSGFMENGVYLLDEAIVKKQAAWKREDVGLRNASVVYHMEPMMDRLIDRGEDDVSTIFDFLQLHNPAYHTLRPVESGGDTYKGRPVVYVINNQYSGEYKALNLDDIMPEQLEMVTIDEHYGTACAYIPDDTDCNEYVVIYLYTTPGNQIRRGPKGIRYTKLEGYVRVKEFYSPDYSGGVLPGETDYRRTLYWNPEVKTDSLGHASVRFYNSGRCRYFDISAEAVTEGGEVGVMNDKR